MADTIFPNRMAKAIVDKWWDDYGAEMLLRGKTEKSLQALIDYIAVGIKVIAEDSLDLCYDVAVEALDV